MPCPQRDANLTFRLEPADAGSVARPRIDDDERSSGLDQLDPARRGYANQGVIHGPGQLAPVHDEAALKAEDVRRSLRGMLAIARAALGQHVNKERPALGRINPIVDRVRCEIEWPGSR